VGDLKRATFPLCTCDSCVQLRAEHPALRAHYPNPAQPDDLFRALRADLSRVEDRVTQLERDLDATTRNLHSLKIRSIAK
jgi:hypothetical protein